MNIFVGNLSFSASEVDVKAVFEAYGVVSLVKIKKKAGQNSRGFGFVTMPDDLQAQAAIDGLQNKEFMGRPMSISMERPKPVKPKKDYKEIKRLRQEAKNNPVVFEAPIITQKETEPKTFKDYKEIKEVKPRKTLREGPKKNSNAASGSKEWQKRKGRGTEKPWKKKPGGVNKKFRHAR